MVRAQRDLRRAQPNGTRRPPTDLPDRLVSSTGGTGRPEAAGLEAMRSSSSSSLRTRSAVRTSASSSASTRSTASWTAREPTANLWTYTYGKKSQNESGYLDSHPADRAESASLSGHEVSSHCPGNEVSSLEAPGHEVSSRGGLRVGQRYGERPGRPVMRFPPGPRLELCSRERGNELTLLR